MATLGTPGRGSLVDIQTMTNPFGLPWSATNTRSGSTPASRALQSVRHTGRLPTADAGRESHWPGRDCLAQLDAGSRRRPLRGSRCAGTLTDQAVFGSGRPQSSALTPAHAHAPGCYFPINFMLRHATSTPEEAPLASGPKCLSGILPQQLNVDELWMLDRRLSAKRSNDARRSDDVGRWFERLLPVRRHGR